MDINIQLIGIIFFFIILVSIQYTLNRIIVLLKEIKYEIQRKK